METFTQHLLSILLDFILSFSWQNKGFAQQLPQRFLPSSRTVSQSGIIGSKTIFVLIIEPIALRNFAHTTGDSMGSPTALTTLTNHWPSGYLFLPRWPYFLLFWLPEEVVWGSGPELSLPSSSSSVAFGLEVYFFMSDPPAWIIPEFGNSLRIVLENV